MLVYFTRKIKYEKSTESKIGEIQQSAEILHWRMLSFAYHLPSPFGGGKRWEKFPAGGKK